jgi:hypothetical protein
MFCDGRLYCDLLDVDTHEVLDSVEVTEGEDIVFQPMRRAATVAIQFRVSPRLVTGPRYPESDDQLVVCDGDWGIHYGAPVGAEEGKL